jgi:hypothetical protein
MNFQDETVGRNNTEMVTSTEQKVEMGRKSQYRISTTLSLSSPQTARGFEAVKQKHAWAFWLWHAQLFVHAVVRMVSVSALRIILTSI